MSKQPPKALNAGSSPTLLGLPRGLKLVPSDPVAPISSQWRELFGSRLATWPAASLPAPGASWAAILSRTPMQG